MNTETSWAGILRALAQWGRRALALALALWLVMPAVPAPAPAPGADFDHLRTGFALSGAHGNLRCESCHAGGAFKGTPRDCESCHVPGAKLARGNVVRPVQHIPTTQACESCHNTRAFSGAKMNHAGVVKGGCTTCHNGAAASGKPGSHPRTTASCDSCHGANAWRPVLTFDHGGVAPGSCASCHDGTRATGRSASHPPFQLVAALSSVTCDTCHRSGFTSWVPTRLHSSVAVSTQCSACHAAAKPANAVHAGQTACENCHKGTSGWQGAKVDHAGYGAATDCASCHNGSAASGKSATHIPVAGTSCFTCHATSGWKPTKWTHNQLPVTNQCASCHTGGYPPADGKGATHTPYQLVAAISSANCDSCHKAGYSAWTPAKLHTSVTVTTQCSTCHAADKPANAVHAGQTACENCHKGTSGWQGAKVDHAGYGAATDCASCHNGSAASGKSATHIPVAGTSCFTCHATSGWKPTKWTHNQLPVTNQCASCHTGGYPPADGKGATHTPYQLVAAISSANCDSCHKAGYSAWTPAKLHTSVTVTTQCSTCHAADKPANAVHAGQTVCENCHKGTSGWQGAKVDHAGYGAATDCASCHNGSAASGKSATHIPVAATNCFTCHGTANWKPTKWTHNQLPVTNQCASCHTGGYPPADGKGATHTPYQLVAAISSANCDSCHKAGYSAWTPAKLHTSVTVTTQCSTCHAADKPANAVHAGQTVCENCHKGTSGWLGAKVDHGGYGAATDCASCHNGSAASGKSATHIPVAATNCFTCHGTANWKPTKWTHNQLPVTNQCASCHTGGYPPADGKGATHAPYQLVAAISSANCDSCHKAGYSAWTPAKLHTSVTVTTQCSTCHAGIKPATVVHAGQTVCESCHKSTSTWTGARVDHSTFTAATDCASCHNGGAASGKTASHIPVGATGCYTCHGTTTWRPSKWNHTQLPVVAQCASCHTGSYPPADGKGATHTPYQLVAAISSANCDGCHKAGYSAWTPARLHTSVAVTTQCASCHAGIKPATAVHAGQTVCETCHKSTSTWTGARVDHGTYTAATNCASCHNGSAASGKSATHVPVGATNCYTCHGTTTWQPSKWNHTQLPVTNQCASCHTGGYPPADGKPASHTPYQLIAAGAAANCDTCHKSGYASWIGAKVHTNLVIATQCATCHAGIKPATAVHAGQTVCETCHKSTSTWTGARVDHGTYTAATNCASCHNGSAASGKSATHVPVGATNCYTCHGTTTWQPSKWNHTQMPVTNQCASCHTGGYPPADGKPASHTPYQLVAAGAAANCDACHKSGYVSWTGAKVHVNLTIVSQCSTCHLAIRPSTQVHVGQTQCESCHRSTSTWTGARIDHSTFTAATDCTRCHNGSTATGKPLTHIPVGTTNCYACHNATLWRPTKWNHTQVVVTAQCASCHTGSYPPADGKPASHLPYQLVSTLASVNCDACHKGSYATWANGRVHANVTVTGQCKTCHSGSYAAAGATGKPANHIPEVQLLNGAAMECNACHTSTSSWGSMRMNHNNSLGGGAGWCKACHLRGTTYAGSMERHTMTHKSKTPPAVDCSESGCHRPLGSKGATFSKWD